MGTKVASKPGRDRRAGAAASGALPRSAEAPPRLSGAQRSAIFLLALPEEVASAIFRTMEADEIRRIMAAMETLGNVSSASIKAVFEEFAGCVRSGPVALEGGADYLRGALNRAIGADRARSVLGEAPSAEAAGPIALGNVDPKALANVLAVEHPQTIALLLANMDARQAAGVLACLREEVQQDVMGRVARLKRVSPEVVREIEQSILGALQALGAGQQREVKGAEQAAALLNNMERRVGVELLSRLEAVDVGLAGQIRQSMFTFEDLQSVDDRGMQAILKEISSDGLLLALKTASDTLKGKFFRNMSSRAAEMMRDDLSAMGPARLADVERAQQEIAQIALRLQEEGTIVIAGAGEAIV